ncbi:hypothetical protein [Kocuria rosea]|jgi:hypothetical protein|uniref:hypothetical protein n=1 Tax=Kocuria rosea TaxID=1275 RepID=UPI00203BFD65|nr:hypothetical protein [Kocuria rosea]MCM3687686.1 hypothetical protein [Kocuria rosea]HST71486.1 hypothetical protein [Kocuria rosea]
MSRATDPDDVVPRSSRTRRGPAVAATALAVLLLTGLGLSPAMATATLTASPYGAPGSAPTGAGELDPEVAERLAGVAQDLAEAITHGEITELQAAAFLQQVSRRIAG